MKTSALSTWNCSAMACTITIHAPSRDDGRVAYAVLDSAAQEALDVFQHVQDTCSRFDPASALMTANDRPSRWHRLPQECFDAIHEAYQAYVTTSGIFDPRVHDDLVALGYDRSLRFADGDVVVEARQPRTSPGRGEWKPRFRRSSHSVNLGGSRVDLGGIGKGLALRWASQRLGNVAGDFLIDAGGDCYAHGTPGGAGSSDSGGWRIGMESPTDDSGHVAVLEVRDLACATSSVRVRNWTTTGRRVHHIIDPRTGEPGGEGLASVTVVAEDPAWAEVWSKTLFLTGPERIAGVAEELGVAALWVDTAGRLSSTELGARYLVWTRS